MANDHPKYVSRRATVVVFSWLSPVGARGPGWGELQERIYELIAGKGGLIVKDGPPMAVVWMEKHGQADERAGEMARELEMMLDEMKVPGIKARIGMGHGLCLLLDIGRGFDAPCGPAVEEAMRNCEERRA